ncbi:MAG TPA: CarD family transcriptional regulator, partial [Myxococcales bacterium]|nr:CarD family transcriptional regulator [Myxococcales bacterium]
SAAGYNKSPVVEDPGTFAIRGGVFDVWSPLDPTPTRLEFFGDFIEKIRAFDPVTQRTIRELTELSLCPAREIVLDEEGRKTAIAAVRAAADLVNIPTRQLRELIDDLQTHAQDDDLFAARLTALLPGFYPGGLAPISEYLPKQAIWVLDDPLEQERQWGDLWKVLEESYSESQAKGGLALPPDQHFLHERDVRPVFDAAQSLELSGLMLGGHEAARGTVELEFDLQPTAELRGEIEAHKGDDGALSPLVKRLESLRERGATGIIACHSSAQAERTRRLLLDRNLMAQIVKLPEAVFTPSVHAHLVVGEISRGFIDLHARLGLYSDEDVFGPRARTRKVARRPKTFGEDGADFKDLKEGDLVVHVEHGIARYEGLTRLSVRGFAADFILLQFHGKDKLYLPVGRLRQIQKYTGGDASKVKLDSLQSQTFQKRKARVKEELLKMAAELLDVYAARAAHQGHAFTAPDTMYRQFEADFEFDETPDQEKAIEDVLADMQNKRPMDRLVCGDVGYGKTEVALRAAFKAVEDKKQVA